MLTARLVDVAARAGVSIKTVSNVVNAHPQVRESTRTRVQSVIDELGYRPHAVGRQLRRGRTGVVALAVPEIEAPYFAELAACVVAEASASGLEVIVEQTGGSLEAERRLVDAREAGLVDGLLMSPVATPAAELSERARTSPLVLLGEGPRPDDVDHVGMDDASAAAEATAHLLTGGRRRIAFVGGDPDGPLATSRLRGDGWRAALAAAGAPGTDLDATGAAWLRVDVFSSAAGAAAVAGALASGTRFDALLCASDVLALGALRALGQAGLVPGRDVAVVGWDDAAFAAWLTPTLSSVRPDLPAIAQTALALLGERVEAAGRHGPDAPAPAAPGAGRHVVVGHRLVVRESSAGPVPGPDDRTARPSPQTRPIPPHQEDIS